MLKNLFTFIFFVLISFQASSQNVKKAYKLYQKNDLVKLREVLEKMDIKTPNNPGVYYLYSLLHLTNSLERISIDSAHISILNSKENILNVDEKQHLELMELDITKTSIDSLEDVIDKIEFKFVLKENTVEEYERYMTKYSSSIYFKEAVKNRNVLEFVTAKSQNTWQSYKLFLDKYPYATDVSDAKLNYERLLFEEKTRDGELDSYEIFLLENPLTPYRDSIEKKILIYYSIGNNSSGYVKFLTNYSNSKYVGLALNLWYHSVDKKLDLIDKTLIDNNLYDSLASISSIDKISLLGFFEDSKIGFVDSLGNTILKISDRKYSLDVICSFINSDFFVVEEGGIKIIYNRKFDKIYSGNFSLAEDIGKGIIKIFSDGMVKLIHKSGYELFDKNYEDAYLVNGKYILLLEDGKYGLFSILGKRIYNFIFDDVFQEGSFILFQKDGLIAVSDSEKIFDDGFSINNHLNFLYIDYEYFDSGFLLLFTENEEELLDDKLNIIIPRTSQFIDFHPFGWTSKNEYGIKIFSKLFKFSFSTFFEDLKYSALHFAEKRNSEWSMYSMSSGDMVMSSVDSLFFITDSVFWYRKGIVNNLVFPNSKEVELKNDDKIFVMSSSYKDNRVSYLRVQSGDDYYILDNLGRILPKVEYYHVVKSGDTFSELSEKYNISQSEILALNNRKSKKIIIGEKLKIKGYAPKNILSNTLFYIDFQGKKGIADTTGSTILEPIYDGLKVNDSKNIILIKDQMFGNYNSQRRQVISPLYSSVILPICNMYYSAKKNDYYGIIDSVGNEVLNFEFDRIIEWNDTLVIAKKNDSFSIINIKNNSIIIEFNSFSFIRENGNKLIEIFSKDGYGIYSSIFGEILMPKYDDINKIQMNDTFYFVARQSLDEAMLLVNLVIKENGKIIKNQAMDLSYYNSLNCSN